ncbi:Putative gamma-crystallin [Colletotrichum destructivum]|uniref:Gamma-crystallin n=1 Tax=Colletotrichum destructivum TaxID=34406 RepID=A0AAX4I1R6_9PEZI|nr:Putative gamma-crystallin [Colletotrichum destructivum]
MLLPKTLAVLTGFLGAASAGVPRMRGLETSVVTPVDDLATRAEPWVEITFFNDWDFKGSSQKFRTVPDGKCYDVAVDRQNTISSLIVDNYDLGRRQCWFYKQLYCSGDVLLARAPAAVNLRNYGEFNDKIKSFKCELYSV